MVAVGHRDSGVGRGGDGGGHARYDLELHTGVIERLSLLATSAEHERVAAFEPDDSPAFSRVSDQQGADVLLRARAWELADVDKLSVGPCVGQQARVNQPVVGDDVGGLNQPQSL